MRKGFLPCIPECAYWVSSLAQTVSDGPSKDDMLNVRDNLGKACQLRNEFPSASCLWGKP